MIREMDGGEGRERGKGGGLPDYCHTWSKTTPMLRDRVSSLKCSLVTHNFST